VQYLKDRKIISLDSTPSVNVLTGGVSNVVLSIAGDGLDLVLKQALPELRVAASWVVDRRRTLIEARAIEFFYNLTPANVPRLYDVDPDQFTLVIERASRSMTNWKEDLLSGLIDVEVAAQLGKILGIWHKNSANQPKVLKEFQEDLLFEQLRIDPFYRTVAIPHGSISKRISALIDELESDNSCLVHGDYSPKNILVDVKSQAIVLDFEVAHSGNPVFDLAFLLAHLLCKYEFFPKQRERVALSRAADAFIYAYEDAYEQAAAASLAWHVAAIALARVDGKSPVNYLSLAAQESLRNRSLGILRSDSTPTISEIFSQT
jgi:5-methylthioribose kinase